MRQIAPIFLITGTPGCGKSSVATALMQRFSFGLHIPVDDLREWVVSGIAHPIPVWAEETGRQFHLARQAAAQVTYIYAAAGFAVAIDDVILPGEARALFAAAPAGYSLYNVLLRPSLEVTLERNAQRANKAFDTAVLRDTIRRLHQAMDVPLYVEAGWIVIDSTMLSTDQTVDYILDTMPRLWRGAASHAGD